MTRKDYEMVSMAIRQCKQYNNRKESAMGAATANVSLEKLAKDLATIFEQDNPRFNRSKFLKSCGVEEPERFYCVWCDHEVFTSRSELKAHYDSVHPTTD